MRLKIKIYVYLNIFALIFRIKKNGDSGKTIK